MVVQDWFALTLRVVGILILLDGLGWVLDGLLLKLDYFVASETYPRYYLVNGIAQVDRYLSNQGRTVAGRVCLCG